MNPEHYLQVEILPSRFGKVVEMPRRVAWKLVRPYFAALITRNLELEEQFSALKKDLLATNHRISWLESRLDAQLAASTTDPASSTEA